MGKNLSQAEIGRIIVEVVVELQKASGHALGPTGNEVCPIGGMEGFDSLMGVEATISLEQRLDVELGTETVFVADGSGGPRALSVSEIAERVQALMKTEPK